MPMIAQAASGEAQRVARIDRLGDRAMLLHVKFRAAAGGRKDAILVEALPSLARALRKRPLLRPVLLEDRVAEPGDVQVPPTRRLAMLVPDRLRPVVPKIGVRP